MNDVWPVPPLPTFSVPERVGAKVNVLPAPVIVVPMVRPVVAEVEVAIVTAGPVWS